MSDYPQPVVNEINRPFIEGWQRGELLLQRCRSCGCPVFFPRPHCPRCWSVDLEWQRCSGRGVIVAHTLVYSHVTEPFVNEVPVLFAEINLDGGWIMLARVLNPSSVELHGGIAVELVSGSDAMRFPLPTFWIAEPAAKNRQ